MRKQLAEDRVLPVEAGRLPRERALLLVARHDAADRRRLLDHEGEHALQHGANAPRRVPRLRVEVGDGEAQPRVRRKTARGSAHLDRGRLERVIRREGERAVVLPTGIRRAFRPLEDKVPIEDVVALGNRVDIGHRLLLQPNQLTLQPLHSLA
eukprot:6200411-Pleurochrysis_carterae.AAC.1